MNDLETTKPQLPSWFDPKGILAEYLEGRRTEEIARDRGTTRERLTHWLLKAAEDDWKAAQLQRAVKRKEDAEDAIDSARDALELNKAQAKLKSAQWDLERVCRRIYGDSAPDEPTGKVNIVLNIGIEKPGDGARVIEQARGVSGSLV